VRHDAAPRHPDRLRPCRVELRLPVGDPGREPDVRQHRQPGLRHADRVLRTDRGARGTSDRCLRDHVRDRRAGEVPRAWLEGVKANEPRVYPRNSAIVEAIANGEIEVGFVNHYYLLQALAEQGDLKVANHFFGAGDPGSLVNVAGVGVLGTAKNPDAARTFVEYLLGTEAQTHFARETFEYPLVEGVERDPRLKPLSEITAPDLDLNQLSDLEATLRLLQETGVL
jgi:iron(III) transport system substrate-binding protein